MLLLDDDLRKHRASYVFSRFRIICDKITAILDHLCEILEGDVGARRRIVETAVGVFLDDDRFRVARSIAVRGAHVGDVSPRGWSLPLPYSYSAAAPHQRRVGCMTTASVAGPRGYTGSDDRRRGSCPPLPGPVAGLRRCPASRFGNAGGGAALGRHLVGAHGRSWGR